MKRNDELDSKSPNQSFKRFSFEPKQKFLMDKLFNQVKKIIDEFTNYNPSIIHDSSQSKENFLKSATANFKWEKVKNIF